MTLLDQLKAAAALQRKAKENRFAADAWRKWDAFCRECPDLTAVAAEIEAKDAEIAKLKDDNLRLREDLFFDAMKD